MGTVAIHTARPAAVLLAPLLARQGARVRRETPLLPEADGPRHGAEGQGKPLRLVVVGESTAAGVGVRSHDEGLVRHFAAELAARTGYRIHWQVFARTGATARVASRELVPDAVRESHDIALVVLGVNDTLRLRSLRAWRSSLMDISRTLRGSQRPGGRTVLAGVPDLGAFPALPQPLRTVMGLHARSLDRQLRVLARRFVSVQHVPAPALTSHDFFAADRFHPNSAAYEQWAIHLAQAVHREWLG